VNKDKLETADALLKRIQAERAERYRQQVKVWEKTVKEWEKGGKQGSKPGKPSQPKQLPPLVTESPDVVKPTLSLTPGTTVEEAETRLILMTLEHTRDNKTRAAEILGISLKTLHNKLNKLRGRGKRSEEESVTP